MDNYCESCGKKIDWPTPTHEYPHADDLDLMNMCDDCANFWEDQAMEAFANEVSRSRGEKIPLNQLELFDAIAQQEYWLVPVSIKQGRVLDKRVMTGREAQRLNESLVLDGWQWVERHKVD